MFFHTTDLLRLINANSFYLTGVTNSVVLQSLRWHRKPRWVPMAKSKIFRIPVRPVIPEEDKSELNRLHNVYRTQIKAVRRFLHNEMIIEKSTLSNTSSEKSLREEEFDFQRCVVENDRWNAEVEKIRQNRLHKVAAKREEQILNLVAMREQKMKLVLKEAENAVKKLKEESKHFITKENLDSAIEESLSNIVDYNYAIDMEGNIYGGHDGPLPADKQQLVQ